MNNQDLEKRNKILERRWKIVVVIAILFVISRPVALFIVNNLIHTAAEESVCNTPYVYLNKSTVCEPATIKKTGYAKTQDEITKYINQEIADGRLKEGAVYFRDLENGPVFGINETSDFAPASLLKLPLALVYLTKAEREPATLNETISFSDDANFDIDQYFKPTEVIKQNTPYTKRDLLMRMLKFSDNKANYVLYAHLTETGQTKLITDTFLELGIIAPKDSYDEVVSVRRYASIFRALYNGSFLNHELSEEVLGWMAESNYKFGIEARLPIQIKVANKFGERVLLDGEKQLHDCGVVYYPENPYLLCVMTQGTDFNKLAEVIANISDLIYQEIESRRL